MNQNLILIAEDDADTRDAIAVTPESAGYRTVAAKDGHTAARILVERTRLRRPLDSPEISRRQLFAR
jgi:CheY-like chemotaxis protein